jgi:hypothetical protein
MVILLFILSAIIVQICNGDSPTLFPTGATSLVPSVAIDTHSISTVNFIKAQAGVAVDCTVHLSGDVVVAGSTSALVGDAAYGGDDLYVQQYNESGGLV